MARTRCLVRHTPLSILLHTAAHAKVSPSGRSSILPQPRQAGDGCLERGRLHD